MQSVEPPLPVSIVSTPVPAIPVPISEVPMVTSPSPTVSEPSLPAAVSSAVVPVTLPELIFHQSSSVVEPSSIVSVSSTSDAQPECRRSTRVRTPAVPGAHRSYLTVADDVDSDKWTSVGGNNKINTFIRRQFPSSNDDSSCESSESILSYTIPTETVHDMTISDAISYLSTIQLKSHS